MTKIKYISITFGQQGGIGLPPMIVRVKGLWHRVSDSRFYRLKEKSYDLLERDRLHTQFWARGKFNHTQHEITGEELENILENLRSKSNENTE